MTLTYIEPKGFTKRPDVGDEVFVFARDGDCIGTTKIEAVEWFNDEPEVIHTDCGREKVRLWTH